jgi:chromosome segregation ATPase
MRRESIKKTEQPVPSIREKEFNRTTAEITELSKGLSQKKSLLSQLSEEYIALQNKMLEMATEYEKVSSYLEKSRADVQSLEAIASEKEDYIKKLEERKSSADEELNSYKRSLILKKDAFENEIEDEKAELKKEVRKNESLITSLKVDAEYYVDWTNSLKAEAYDLKQNLATIKDEIEDKELIAKALREVLSSLEEEKEKTSADVTKLINLKTELLSSTEKLESKVKKLEEESVSISLQIDEKKMSMGRLFLKEEKLKEQAHIIKDFYTKNGMKIPEQLNF